MAAGETTRLDWAFTILTPIIVLGGSFALTVAGGVWGDLWLLWVAVVFPLCLFTWMTFELR